MRSTWGSLAQSRLKLVIIIMLWLPFNKSLPFTDLSIGLSHHPRRLRHKQDYTEQLKEASIVAIYKALYSF